MTQLTEYYLHVDITVPEAKRKEFEDLSAIFLKPQFPFEKFSPKANYALEVALCSEPFAHSPGLTKVAGNDGEFRNTENAQRDVFWDKKEPLVVRKYVHLWSVPDIEDLDLARRMRAVADDPLYMSINSLVFREVQTFVRRVRLSAPLDTETGEKFIRVTRRFLSKDIATYLFNAGVLEPTLNKAGWRLQGQYQNVTGALNLVTEFWIIPNGAGSSLSEMLQPFQPFRESNPVQYEQFVSGTFALVQAESRELLRPTSYSPNKVNK